MTQVLGFTVENEGGFPATVIDPNASTVVIGASMTSKRFTMPGSYTLQGMPVAGTNPVNITNVTLDPAGTLTVKAVTAASPASAFAVRTILN
jgi:hypothetical protein